MLLSAGASSLASGKQERAYNGQVRSDGCSIWIAIHMSKPGKAFAGRGEARSARQGPILPIAANAGPYERLLELLRA
eukprot:scaffold1786_cov398-Prasinococcus_capsulatus_cf.AAC.16